MSCKLFCLLFLVGYVCGAPIVEESSIEFRIGDCILDEYDNDSNNQTLSKYILQITNYNKTCIKVNKTSEQGDEIYLYILPSTEDGVQIHIKVDNCSTPLPTLYLSPCDDDDDDQINNNNLTYILPTFHYINLTNVDPISNDLNNSSTSQTDLYTGPTVQETLHHLDDEFYNNSDDVTPSPSLHPETASQQRDSSSEEDQQN